MNDVKFTIIIPCYNSEKWITQCVLSALKQTYKNLEVIFVDNESTDGSVDLVKKIQSEYSELMMSSAKNIYRHSYQEPVEEALRLASGDYFTILGSDDYLDENYIQNIYNILSKTNKISIMQSPLYCVRESENKVVNVIKHQYKSLSEFKEKLLQGCPVTTPSIVVKKKLYDDGKVKWRSDMYLGVSDYELYFSLADQNIFIYPFPKWLGYYYRWNDQQSTWGMHREETKYDVLIREEWQKRWKN
jgi:glycosyltransferase involved in cell wall biosynthesis